VDIDVVSALILPNLLESGVYLQVKHARGVVGDVQQGNGFARLGRERRQNEQNPKSP
jgi:hypothetical protein